MRAAVAEELALVGLLRVQLAARRPTGQAAAVLAAAAAAAVVVVVEGAEEVLAALLTVRLSSARPFVPSS